MKAWWKKLSRKLGLNGPIGYLEGHGSTTELDFVLQVGKTLTEGPQLIQLIQKVGKIPDQRSEQFLLGLLKNGPRGTAFHVIQALGNCGSGSSIETLRPMISDKQMMELLRTEAEKSVAKIQARLGPKIKGTLSMVEGKGLEGAVSPAPKGGAISPPGGSE